MKDVRNTRCILLFALLHALTALGCRAFGLKEDLLLTILTMLLIIIICMRQKVDARFMAIGVILFNFLGLLLGNFFSWVFSFATSNALVIYPLSTFLTTMVIGYLMYLITLLFGSRFKAGGDSGTKWLLSAFVIVIVVRLAFILPLDDPQARLDSVNIILNYLFSCSALAALAFYTMRFRKIADEEKAKANQAQYRYMRLKQQVNPHFLFNSLNLLDCMIQEQSPQSASIYTHKLAEIYRYMIKNEDEKTVSLRDEMSFVGKYVDLLKVRFPEGFKVEIDIPEEAYKRFVVPCCVQLLIENATKHNAVRPENPLVLHIGIEDDNIKVTNNLCPKVGRPSSTGLGLKYIRQQYEDISGKLIKAEKTDREYVVVLPLL